MLAFTFLNPALLPFAALAALPVLIYLFNRQRYTVMKWAAMDFVLRAVKSNRRRLKIENLLLLLLRVAIVLLIAMALARPVAEKIGVLDTLGDKRRQVAILIDTSYSMGLRTGAKSAFERAQKAAHDTVEELQRGDRLTVELMADTPRFLYPDPVFVDESGKGKILVDLEKEVELTAQGTDAAKALGALATYLPRFERAGDTGAGAAKAGLITKQVYIFTDMQRGAFATERGLKDPNLRRIAAELERQKAEITIVDCGSDDVTNCAVTRLEAGDEVAGVDIPLRITATVKNFGPQPVADLGLELYVDTELQSTTQLSLEAGEEKQVERYVTFREKGGHRVHVALKTDNLPVDNARALALDVREGV
ncbi:MAG TPA: BatA domain-containing protein, partial [Planctomycetota bacterium]|nr:BatA domain-containing protein [Planctomycetota bacterium]